MVYDGKRDFEDMVEIRILRWGNCQGRFLQKGSRRARVGECDVIMEAKKAM